MNQFKTVLLLGALTGLLVAAGGFLGGRSGMLIALVVAAAMNFFSYWYSDKIVLKMYGAQPLDEARAPGIHAMVRELTQEAGLPMPRIYLIDNETPNAFATGRDPDHAVVAVTRGIVDLLSPRELKGVLGHELGHVRHRDILISSVAATLAGAVMVLANLARFAAIFGGGSRDDNQGGGGIVGLIAMSILAPLAALLIQMAVSRSREYLADRAGAELSHDPGALADALGKLESFNQRRPMAGANPQTAHMFIVNPLSGRAMANLFSTHPPMAERMARLRAMSPGGAQPGGRPGYDTHVAPPPPPPPPPAAGPGRPSAPGRGRGGIDWS
ncbi:MAG: zinc metalloprotease HtpX [Deltaproteobacteria bacterium]|nr:zinc metalloprotease HtpX [Deltaproteobacteria bacterium]